MSSTILPELICLRRLGLIADLWEALRRCRLVGMLLSVTLLATLNPCSLMAQGTGGSATYPLLDQRVPPGTWGEWIRNSGRVQGWEFQTVRVEFPSSGTVQWLRGSRDNVTEAAQVKLAVGQLYRFRLSDLPEFPGVELYPSIEVLDRLHPPAGHADSFPMPLVFTVDELDAVIEGRMLTKVIYLEQPQFAVPFELSSDTSVKTVSPRDNLIAEADKAGRPLALVRLGGRVPAPNETRGAFFGNEAPVLESRSTRKAAPSIQAVSTFSPAEPRVQLASRQVAEEPGATQTEPRLQQNRTGLIAAEPSLAEQFPDEYLFDGGDGNAPVHYDGTLIRGLESEDTVAEYRDHEGRRKVKASNRVAIYSPRFAAVRTFSGASEGFNVQRVTSHLDQVQGAGLRQQLAGKTGVQRDRVQNVRMRSRASGVAGQANRQNTAGVTTAAQHNKLLNLFEGVQFLRDGQLRQSELALLKSKMHNAVTMSRELNPILMANLSGGQEVYAMFKVAELSGTDEDHKQPGRLRIIKLADKDAAKPGDVITFTIRFDNLGDRSLQHVRIIDNLTPRLEYVEDSASSDLPGSIHTDDNGEGSHVLRFELDDPLTGHSGGVISFQAKLR